MKALIIFDIQNDFLPGGAVPVKKGNTIIPIINRLLKRFELVVATQDWHPANHHSFASSHPGKQNYEDIYLHGQLQTLWPAHCIQGTYGAAISAELNQAPVAAIFRKGMHPELDSYSGFYDNGHINSTGLAGYLNEKMVEEVYLTGLMGDYGVYYTAMDSLRLNFKTFLVEDATLPLKNAGFQESMEVFVSQGGQVVQSCTLLKEHLPLH